MKTEEIIVDNTYQCTSKLLKESFLGKVKIKFEKSCIVEVLNNDTIDDSTIKDLQNKIVISYKDMKKIKNNKEIA